MSQLHPDYLARPQRETATGAVHLHNYDVETAHRVWITVVADGERTLEATRRLRPGGTASIADAIPPGEYDVEVGIDGLRRGVERCRVGDDSEQNILVEIGNGVVSIADGAQ